ncbi:MAG: tRNA 2-thiouridine(34) synthase MnmA [Porphyromonas sp.]|nr:tRNA 2-thiouridine(34) synthase MnmA [Porphyromonas sp.]
MMQNLGRTALLLSGGVDSSVALQLLVEQGVRPDLYYIQIGADEEGFQGCSAEEDLEMCRWLARHYDLRLFTSNLHQEYWDYVVGYIIDTVREGRTPHPDMMCNRIIKFGYFDDRWGASYDTIATGHYADKRIIEGKHYLATAKDPVKDQTDFLAQITYPQLVKAHFPLGKYTKDEVREIAETHHLITSRRKDSQGICFLGKVNYNDFLEKYLGTKPGEIIDQETGLVLGEHQGYWFHTIGQRKGLGLGGGPWYVVGKDVSENKIYVSRGFDTEAQYGDLIGLAELNFISGDPMPELSESMEVTFKIRHTPDFTRGVLERREDGSYLLTSTEMMQGIAPGQYCTLYDSDHHLCFGSGLIVSGARKSL